MLLRHGAHVLQQLQGVPQGPHEVLLAGGELVHAYAHFLDLLDQVSSCCPSTFVALVTNHPETKGSGSKLSVETGAAYSRAVVQTRPTTMPGRRQAAQRDGLRRHDRADHLRALGRGDAGSRQELHADVAGPCATPPGRSLQTIERDQQLEGVGHGHRAFDAQARAGVGDSRTVQLTVSRRSLDAAMPDFRTRRRGAIRPSPCFSHQRISDSTERDDRAAGPIWYFQGNYSHSRLVVPLSCQSPINM